MARPAFGGKDLSARAGLVIGAAVLLALAWRITIGFDFSDEAYYAAFLDDWLKEGIARSPLLTLHQTAALLVYPAALLFHYVQGSTEGLFLFLRALYLAGAVFAACVFYHFMRPVTGRTCAYLGALAALCFIHGGLPAPSYNTLAIQWLTVALCTMGCALMTDSPRRARLYMACSAFAWAIAIVAYPTVIIGACAAFFLLPWRLPHKRDVVLRFYLPLMAALLLVAAAVLISVFSWGRLYQSVLFIGAFNGSFSVSFKLKTYIFILLRHKGFCGLCMAAVVLGFARTRWNPVWISALSAGLLVAQCLYPDQQSILIFRSDDVMTLAGLTGLSLLLRRKPGASEKERIVAALYGVSFCAGLATAASSTNGLMNFCVGGAPAALLAMSAAAIDPSGRKPAAAGLAVFACVLLLLGLNYFYSDKYFVPAKRDTIDWGPARGLHVADDVASVMLVIKEKVNPALNPGDTILTLGRLPGLSLLTPAATRALCIYPMQVWTTAKALAMVHAYYHVPANRPTIVVLYKDRYMRFINPFGSDFERWYALQGQYTVLLGTLEVYRKKGPE